jgi:uncharacterized membrane protein YhaH (DUF805 family)
MIAIILGAGVLIGTVLSTGGGALNEFSGLIVIFGLLVLVYSITMLVFLCQDSHENDNKYGPSPKYNTGASVFD